MYSDESTFSLVNLQVRHGEEGQVDEPVQHRYVVKTVKHSASVMVWACFSGKKWR
jgi:hypothetical protein